MSKIQSESNSQLDTVKTNHLKSCGSNVKDTIWKQFTTDQLTAIGKQMLWFQCQRYNLKAIHNWILIAPITCIVVVPMSKIQSESNSQLDSRYYTKDYRCGSNVKDTIWKQFTTIIDGLPSVCELWFQCQRYNLKAIHNQYSPFLKMTQVVVPMSKIQSESNSQPGGHSREYS